MMPLTDNVALLSAWANDVTFAEVFAEQMAPLARPGDVLLAISASGNSPNVVAAVEKARQCDVFVIGLTGAAGGRLSHMADICVNVPVAAIEQVEDAHLAISHTMCVALRQRLRAIATNNLASSFVSSTSADGNDGTQSVNHDETLPALRH